MIEIRVAGLFASNAPPSNALVQASAPPFTASYIYVQNGKEIHKEVSGKGYAFKNLWCGGLRCAAPCERPLTKPGRFSS